MDIRDHHTLKQSAGQSLADALGEPGKLILIHTGAVQLVALILAVLDYYLERQIGGTGGLSGMGTRSVLETVRTVLQLSYSVALPFWQVGYLWVALRITRGQQVGQEDLAAGFRRFFPMLRLFLLQGLLYMAIAIVVSYPAGMLFMFSPWAQKLYSAEFLSAEVLDTEAMMEAMMAPEVMLPLMCIFAVLYLAIFLPVSYRLRLSRYCLLENPHLGAMGAMRESTRMMRGNANAMLKLDLSFWWYYGLSALAAATAYLDVLLPAMGVTLPWSKAVSYFGAFVLCGVCQVLLHWWRKNQVEVTYAHAYERLRQPMEETPIIVEAGNVPWKY